MKRNCVASRQRDTKSPDGPLGATSQRSSQRNAGPNSRHTYALPAAAAPPAAAACWRMLQFRASAADAMLCSVHCCSCCSCCTVSLSLLLLLLLPLLLLLLLLLLLQTWKPPLERWAQRQKQLRLTCHNVKQLSLPPPAPESPLSLTSSNKQQQAVCGKEIAAAAAIPSSNSSNGNNSSETDT